MLSLGCASLGAAQISTTCLVLENFANTQYVAEVAVGSPGQTVKAIPDTGSNELIIPSVDCKGYMGVSHRLFDAGKSSTFHSSGPEDVNMYFGQGGTVCKQVKDTFTAGTLKAEKAEWLLMTEQTLEDYDEAVYDGILGLGREADLPDDGSVTEDDVVNHTLRVNYHPDGPEDPAVQLESVAVQGKKWKLGENGIHAPLLARLGAHQFSVCYSRNDGGGARLVLGPDKNPLQLEDTLTFPAANLTSYGISHWGLPMQKLSLGGREVECVGGCGAILDSGSSFSALPPRRLKMVNHFLQGGFFPCSAIDQLPNLDFFLNGHKFTLKPEDYMVAMDTSAEESARLRLMHTQLLSKRTELSAVGDSAQVRDLHREGISAQLLEAATQLLSNATASQEAGSLSEGFGSGICVPAMTDLDELTNMGPMLILGVPFMRAFHATFSRKGVNEGTITLGRISRTGDVCSSCDVAPKVADSVSLSNVMDPAASEPDAALHARRLPIVKLSKLRMSSSLRRTRARRQAAGL